MPTGYTSDVADGKIIEFSTFALRCARAFGATVTQRENPMDELPKHREVSPFYADELKAKESELERLAALTEEQAEQEMRAEVVGLQERNELWRREREEKRSRYEAMLANVRAWVAPTPDHQGLKEFMEKQLTESIDFDCSDYSSPIPTYEDASDWLLQKRAEVAGRIAYYRRELQKEQERVVTANAWIDALYESLGEMVRS